MQLTKRQVIFLTTICLLASKVQRLPSLISTPLGRHGYLVFLIMGAIDTLMLMVCLWFNRLAGKGQTTYDLLKSAGGSWLAKGTYILFSAYFLFNAVLPFEAVHDMFAHVLFDNLSWEIYSLIMVIAIIFIATRGLKNLGRLSEVFFYLIILSFISLFVMGAATTSFDRCLPLADVDAESLISTCLDYNLWFGDFLIIYMFVGLIKEDDGKLGWPIVIVFLTCTLTLSTTYMIFYGLYQNLAAEQTSLISSISQYALLGLDIGRVDWFLVLFFQISTIISSVTYLLLTATAVNKVISKSQRPQNLAGKKLAEQKLNTRQNIVICTFALTIYLLDIFVFKSNQTGVAILANTTKYFGVFMTIILPIILLICAMVFAKKRKKQEKTIQNSYKNLVFTKRTAKTARAAKAGEK